MRLTLVCVLFLVACGGPTGTGSGGGGGGDNTGMGGGMVDTANHTVDGSELSCDVVSVLARNCASCHGSPPAANALVSTLSRADLTAAAPDDMGITIGELSEFRMQSTGPDVMPPAGSTPATASDIQVFTAWVAAGMLPGNCTGAAPPATTCPSNSRWTFGDSGSTVMNPGLACITCHASREPREKFTAGGTVFTDLHTEDLCNGGAKSGGKVEIIDANGVVTSLSVNTAGNFYTFANIAMPYTARVTFQGNTRTMSTPQVIGDCNTCHTAQGLSGAPGRIIWPD